MSQIIKSFQREDEEDAILHWKIWLIIFLVSSSSIQGESIFNGVYSLSTGPISASALFFQWSLRSMASCQCSAFTLNLPLFWLTGMSGLKNIYKKIVGVVWIENRRLLCWAWVACKRMIDNFWFLFILQRLFFLEYWIFYCHDILGFRSEWFLLRVFLALYRFLGRHFFFLFHNFIRVFIILTVVVTFFN